MSLHIEMLPELIRLFSEAIKDGKQIIITTHSSDLPSILKICIPNFLTSKDVAIYELKKGKNGSTAKRLRLLKDGTIKGWIPSFADAEKRLIERE